MPNRRGKRRKFGTRGGGVIEHICGTFDPVVFIVIGGNSVHLSQNCSKVAGPRMKQMEI